MALMAPNDMPESNNIVTAATAVNRCAQRIGAVTVVDATRRPRLDMYTSFAKSAKVFWYLKMLRQILGNAKNGTK